jgi:hypothetical protein
MSLAQYFKVYKVLQKKAFSHEVTASLLIKALHGGKNKACF